MHKYFFTILAVTALSLCSCSVQNSKITTDEGNPVTINNVVLMPSTTDIYNRGKSATQHNQAQELGVQVLTSLLSEYFADNENINPLSEDQVDGFNVQFRESKASQAAAIGRALHADAVMLWNLKRYQEREGGEYTVIRPASVAFNYRLLLTESGQTVCSGIFDETQTTITDNLLSFKKFFKRKLKWIKAEELARDGIRSELAKCSYLGQNNQTK